MRTTKSVIIIGAGIGGLAAAALLSARGIRVTLFERLNSAGGKMRTVPSEAGDVDAGPTVLTLRHVFDDLFESLGHRLEEHLTLIPLPCLARHFWSDGTQLDLPADQSQRHTEIERVFGTKAAADFAAFSHRARNLFDAFDNPMMRNAAPRISSLARQVMRNPQLFRHMAPGQTLAGLAFRTISEPRLAQLVARYATYVGGSPWQTPALLSLIWEAEAKGVWSIDGGMHRLARAIETLAVARGAAIHYGTPVARILTNNGHACGVRSVIGDHFADAILFNGDPRALRTGALGQEFSTSVPRAATEPRSLSADVLAFSARSDGVELSYHNVFFGDEPRAEFAQLERGRRPADATLYLCAQDRSRGPVKRIERFETIRNAPPLNKWPKVKEDDQCLDAILRRFQEFGLTFSPKPDITNLTDPTMFNALFPASQGSLYGRSPRGLTAAMKRPTARSAVPGLYLCGGGTHPGAGVPMAALSGRHAAEAILTDLTSI